MKEKVIVTDKMQEKYTYYRVCAPGKDFSEEFSPELTPKEMLSLGVFGGVYMRDCTQEFPKSWFINAKFSEDSNLDKEKNFFKILASQSLSTWRNNGWINEAHDPRGWFQWYCRYYMGRRIKDYDDWQIKRWKQMKRHIGQIRKHCMKGDFSCRPRQRQAVLQWAYDSREL